MTRGLTVAWLLTAFLFGTACYGEEDFKLDEWEREFMSLVNTYRLSNDLPILLPDKELTEGARVWASKQTYNLKHDVCDTYAECVAVNVAMNPRNVLRQWQRSRGHNGILLGWYNRGGIGFHGDFAVFRARADENIPARVVRAKYRQPSSRWLFKRLRRR